MSSKTEISWCDSTWNPVTGCTPRSPGCDHCYAIRDAKRHMGEFSKDHSRLFSEIRCHEEKLTMPLRWKKPRRIFVNSMSDLFHRAVPFDFVNAVFAVMALCPQHTFQILTKRPERMLAFLTQKQHHRSQLSWEPKHDREWLVNETAVLLTAGDCGLFDWPLPNVWLGVTTEDQERADERISLLLQCPAAGRFVSVEPMLSSVMIFESGCPHPVQTPRGVTLGPGAIGGVICGGETGPGARPMHPDWARSLRDQCEAAMVPFFFKQWGEYGPDQVKAVPAVSVHSGVPMDEPAGMFRLGKHAAGRILDGREHNDLPWQIHESHESSKSYSSHKEQSK